MGNIRITIFWPIIRLLQFVYFWWTQMSQTSMQFPFCCVFSVFVVHISGLATYSEIKQWKWFKLTWCMLLYLSFWDSIKRIFRYSFRNLTNIRISKLTICLSLIGEISRHENIAQGRKSDFHNWKPECCFQRTTIYRANTYAFMLSRDWYLLQNSQIFIPQIYALVAVIVKYLCHQSS